MLLPPLRPGVEQRYLLPRLWIFTVDVRPLARVAVGTRQGRIGQIGLPTARPWENMVDLKAADLELRGQLTVFTAVASALDYHIPELFGYRAHRSGTTPGIAVRSRAKAV